MTLTENPCEEALPGYKKVQPMVYCGLYPADGAKYGDLRDALEKLQLNDASLQFEAETSVALGFGFRCGFLGLLHLEIIQERLEREYNLDLVTTAPGVIYKVYKTNGEVVEVTNPSNLPDPSEIEHMEEPVVSAEIMVTTEFVGAIMNLCQERRGVYNGMEYLEETRAVLKYDLPLNEIIYEIHKKLSGGREEIRIQYEPDVELDEFESKLRNSQDRDMRAKMTSVGPHRDDFSFLVGDVDIRKFGSQGQQRTAALSLKLSEIELVKRITKDTPVLLLDDVLSELDSNRQNYLLNSIGDIQTIITCTGLDEFVRNRFQIDKIFEVISGTVSEKNEM